MKFFRYIITLLAILCCAYSYAQSTRVRGRVTDSEGKPLQFASVAFVGTTVGMVTDEQGLYSLETRDTMLTLRASMMGYITVDERVERGRYSEVNFTLRTADISIDQVVITPGENPAFPILDSMIRRKALNNPDEYDSFHTETYTKMELGLSKIKEEFRNKRMQRNFGFIFDYVDTSALTGQRYLPAMISETKADYYHRKRPSLDREVIIANRVSGVDDTFSIAQFTGQMQGDVNFYHNFIDLFNIRFASPAADGGRLFYRYFLVDSLLIDGRKSYRINFHPRGSATPTLDGEMYIDSASYALRTVRARLPRRANVNWIKHLQLESDHKLLDSAHWFRNRDRMMAEFTIAMADSSKIMSIIGTREIAYSNTRIGIEIPENVEQMDNNVVLPDADSIRRDEHFWEQARPYRLSDRERGIYQMIDSIQHTPLYRNIYTIVNTIIAGYYNTKYIGIGPYYKLLSFNRLEGIRPQIGGRTTSNFSRKIRLSAFAAYGTKDQVWKMGGGIELMFNRAVTRKLTLKASHDVQQLGAGENALTGSNFLSSVFSRGDQRLSMVNEAEALYEHEWVHGISGFIGSKARRIYSNRYVPMALPNGTEPPLPCESVDDATVTVGLRLSKEEKIYRRIFDKSSLGSRYPIFTVSATAGLKNFVLDSHEYYRTDATIYYRPEFPPFGYSDITIKAGKIWGRLPYPLLKLHESNGTYFYDPYAFSCMNYYEFASDQWISCFYEHHFNGFFLGRIPLLKRLHLREVLVVKGVWGSLSDKNNGSKPEHGAPMLFPVGMSSVRKPYFEAGVGVENIARLVRIDFIWRLSHRDKIVGAEPPTNFAINASVQLKF